MRLITYRTAQGPLAGLVVEDTVYDLNQILRAREHAPVESLKDFLAHWNGEFESFAGGISDEELSLSRIGPLDEIDLAPLIPDPAKVLCVGLNYRDHVGETGRSLPEYPDVFTKFAGTLIGSRDDIGGREVTESLDFEGELAIIIGAEGRDIPESDALSHIAGFSIMNDITARDIQYRGTQWVLGKSVEGSTPLGPELVTLDEIPDLDDLHLETRVNGEVVQSSNTSYLIFSPAKIVSYLSQFFTLSPGDVIATGTPAGIGAKRTPPLWLRKGDLVEVEVAVLGSLRNIVR